MYRYTRHKKINIVEFHFEFHQKPLKKNLYHIGSNELTVFGNKSKIPQTDEKVVILELFFGYLIEYLSVFKQSSASIILAQNINSHLKMEPAKRASQVRHLFLLVLCHLTVGTMPYLHSVCSF